MRIVVFGIGAIGGVVVSRLALSGADVIGIARGAQLDAIGKNGLLLRTPDGEDRARFTCVGSPAEIDWRPDDAILLTMKSQDTHAALLALRDAGVTEQPIFCAQNGVANEATALRLFPNVYGVMVGMPADYLTPGEVNVFSAPVNGIFDVGRYPHGIDDVGEAFAAILTAAGITCGNHPHVMQSKYAKLLMNLGNIINTALGEGGPGAAYAEAARKEAEAVLAAAAITHDEQAGIHRHLLKMRDIPGVKRTGSSSAQSLVRGTGSIETDYLNGEIVLLGRLNGVPVPVNTYFAALGHRMLAENLAPANVAPEEIAKALPLRP